jgi:hypothetical protein
MALTSASTFTDAMAQYNNSLRWWESSATASSLLEAVEWLLANRALFSSASGTSVSFSSLEALRAKLIAEVSSATSARPRAYFVQGRAL